MRLIDADSIRGCAKYIKTNEKFEPYIMIDDLAKLLDEQQTAYDIGKVVKELESFAKLTEDRWTNGTSKHAYQEHKCWVKSIEIV